MTNLDITLKYQIIGTPTFSGNNFTINGIVNDEKGVWDASHVKLGDRIYFLEEDVIYPLTITTINSASGTILNVTAESITPLLSTSPSGNLSGQVIVVAKTTTGFYPNPSGLGSTLAAAVENRFKQEVEIIAATDVLGYVETTIDTFPSSQFTATDVVTATEKHSLVDIKTFVGASAINPGMAGLVPSPKSADDTKFLRGDATWQTIQSGTVTGRVRQNGADIKYDIVSGTPVVTFTKSGGTGTIAVTGGVIEPTRVQVDITTSDYEGGLHFTLVAPTTQSGTMYQFPSVTKINRQTGAAPTSGAEYTYDTDSNPQIWITTATVGTSISVKAVNLNGLGGNLSLVYIF